MTQRWWRTARLEGAAGAQASLDRFWATTGDARARPGGRSVGELGDSESLLPLPVDPFPATVDVERTVSANCTIAFRGNHYSTPPGLVGATVTIRHRLGTLELGISSAAGVLLATQRPAAPSDCRRMPPRWSGSSLPRSPLPGPASARPTGHPAPRHRRPPIS